MWCVVQSFQQRGDDVTDPNSEITVLAPSNDAFASLDADTAAALQAAPELLGPVRLPQTCATHAFLCRLLQPCRLDCSNDGRLSAWPG